MNDLTVQSPTEQRFWNKVSKYSPNGCWLWTAAISANGGYGLFWGFEHRGEVAHRAAWKLINGPIPDGMNLCHNCPGGDNPACVNPAHLFLGTQSDNIQDCINKGRWNPHKPLGETNQNHKLIETDIPVIRQLHAQGVTYRELGRRYGVSHHTIGAICRYEMWAWVP